MPIIDLKYGHSSIPFNYDADRFEVLGCSDDRPPLADEQIGTKIDDPIGSEKLEYIVSEGDTVLIVVPDATRHIACGQMVNLLVRRLIANGINAFDIRIIFATGIHRKVTDDEKASILTPFIAQRIKTLDHDPRDLAQIVSLGETATGIPIELNRALFEHDKVILIGGISFHYFAGFTGGRKLICPGLGSSRTIAATHKLAFDCKKMARREGIGTGLLDGNAVHEAFEEIVRKTEPSFAINTMVNDDGYAIDLFCGNWISAHRAACEAYGREHTIELSELREMVIVSAGGFPHDINMIQAHKALEAASKACKPAGTILLIAECSEGTGRSDFLSWFESGNSDALARTLCENYKVNGQTAWSLLKKTEAFNVCVMTKMSKSALEQMRFTAMDSLDDAIRNAGPNKTGYIMTNGAKLNIRIV